MAIPDLTMVTMGHTFVPSYSPDWCSRRERSHPTTAVIRPRMASSEACASVHMSGQGHMNP